MIMENVNLPETPMKLDLTKLSQQNVPALLDLARQKLKELKGDSSDKDSKMATTLFPGIGDLAKQDITPSDLIKAYSAINAKEKAYLEAAQALNVSTTKYPFYEGGVTAEQWKRYIERRIAVVINKTQISKYEETIKNLELILSEEDKVKNTLNKIADIFRED